MIRRFIYPFVGSIGLTAYLIFNNKIYINYKNRKLIEDLQLKSTILVMEHFQINQHFGKTLTSTLERESTLSELNKTKNTLNFEMKIKKGKNFDIDDYFAQILVNSSISSSSPEWNINTVDIQFKEAKPRTPMRLYESLQYQLTTNQYDNTLNQIISSSNLNVNKSKECLINLREKVPFVLSPIERLLNDEQKIIKIGPPIVLNAKIAENPEKLNMKIRVSGEKQSVDLYINAEKIDKKNFNLNNLGIMYELNEDCFLSSSELATKYVNTIVSASNGALTEILNQINLSKVIEEKLFKNSRALDSIGRPVQVSFKQETNFTMDDQKMISQLILVFNGKLNSAQITVDFSKNNSEKKWKVIASSLKMIWQSKN